VGHGVLADHDGVIDDDAERHDQREQAQHVDAAAGEIEDEQGRGKGHRDAPGDPERDPPGQEQVEDQHHQHQTAQAVAHQQHDAVAHQLPGGVVDGDLHTRGQRRAGVGEPLLQHLGGLQCVALLGALQGQCHGRLAVDTEPDRAVAGPALDLGNVAQVHPQLVVAAHRQAGELQRVAALVQAPELARTLAAAHRAGRQVTAERGNAVSDVLQTQVELLQLLGVHLDADLLVRQAVDIDLVDATIEQLGLEAAGQATHLGRVLEAGQQ